MLFEKINLEKLSIKELTLLFQSLLDYNRNNEENEKLFDAPEEISFQEILERMGREYSPKAAQHLGYVFRKKLQLNTKRRNNGTVLLLSDPKNSRKLKYLYRRYGT